MVKKLFAQMLGGMAMTLGGYLMTEMLKVYKNPDKRAAIKKNIRNIKDTFEEKVEA